MTQAERRLYLIRSLLNEKTEYQSLNVPRDAGEQRKLLRSLMNVRMAAQRGRRRRLHRTAGERRPAVLTTPPLAAQRPQGERTAGSCTAANKRYHRREPRKNSRLFFPAEKTWQVTGKLRLHRVTQGYTDATRQV